MADADVPLPTSAVLTAVSKQVGIRCSKVNQAYMQCKAEHSNPADCLGPGNEVTGCLVDLLKEVHAQTPAEFKKYYECLDYNSNKLHKCRTEQKAFEAAFKPKA
ncbi:NADH dehydrogenase [ubiquinone] 1 alpha subcomplex subunit 8 [Auxenochlorella protothecoides]|uniref:NADH dehydrogenase [ubiquinone] 1 alpha subcomplex subunit 8 n=1 Tax=Auxenochlorella protothecoides TaxID=3075 RepID=A0A087SLA9_AUXPR|nr:NADH dehydrogenase [ubiquinone] 1 alpha subcomplex subunit 8 [Auxenochlorella protothecoides]KFM26513.1 NADH dehydrogenase [ubiquinone] 1 alpha subcomplex subunit 8 [Auxenochlorella protothecoides]RMZ56048.1 hypothetical protein APUTEX25_004472 [Auxenochlorella protothecoides]|eukprot:RMZ56048.1 hypothetical protein APUTEX25_004472 [Auxenochlorella protothecoides]